MYFPANHLMFVYCPISQDESLILISSLKKSTPVLTLVELVLSAAMSAQPFVWNNACSSHFKEKISL